MKCNCCLALKLVNHKCLEKSLETNCPICCEFLFTSSATVRSLPCGHFMHSACFQVSILLNLVIILSAKFYLVVLSHLFPPLLYKIFLGSPLTHFVFHFDLLGIRLQELCLSNMQQIYGGYGGKRTFTFFQLLNGIQ